MITALTLAEEKIELPELITQKNIISYLSGKDFWDNLRIIFNNYFSGKSFRNGVKASELNLEILCLAHAYYLSFYNLIWYAWDDIKQEINTIFDINLINPGDLLKIVLCTTAEEWMNKTPVAEPQTLYKAWKAHEIKDTPNIKKWIGRIEKQTGTKCTELDKSTRIVALCVEIGKSSKSQFIKNKAIEFEKQSSKQINFAVKQLRKEF